VTELLDYHERWVRLVHKVADDGYAALSTEERVCFNSQ